LGWREKKKVRKITRGINIISKRDRKKKKEEKENKIREKRK